ncbi:GlsB/YeaQ/YmgE family stress response membrane protein [bacterium]|nr:MAG: GlsB/YeaQ/YmgE family stress response membrane protein [bacterium]
MGQLIAMIIIGAIAGILAKSLTPGTDKEPKGCLMTIALGIVGSVLVGFLMSLLGLTGTGGWIATIIGATIGAVIIILLMRKFWK